MRLVIALAALGVSVSGCASYVWYKPEATPDLVQRDERECNDLASDVAWDYGFWYAPYWGPGFDWPAASPRWFGGPDPVWRMDAERRIADRCMERKGYRLEKQPRGESTAQRR